MDAHRTTIAQTCLEGSRDGSLAFPDIVRTLAEAGFEGYLVDYRRHRATYFLPDGDSLELCSPPAGGHVAAVFDPAGVAAQVKWAQANPPDYAYAAFCQNVMAFGCAGYMVSFLGRRVLYFGRTAETHVEHFPR